MIEPHSRGAMRVVIEAGSILIERGALIPDSWLSQGEPYSNNWISVGKRDRSGLEASIHKAGWTFFYLAGEIRATVFGFDEQETARKAVKQLITRVKAQRLNGLEISQVSMSSCLGVRFATVVGHARHIQKSMVLSRTTTLKSEPAQMDCRRAAEAKAELSDKESNPMEVVV